MKNIKPIFAAFALIFSWAGTEAQITNLLFYSADKEPFYLFINGVSQNQMAATGLRVTGVPRGPVQAFVLFANPSYPALSNTLNFHEGTETMIGIIKGIGGGYIMSWKGEVPISAASRPGPGMTVVSYNDTPPPHIGPGGALNMMGSSTGQHQDANSQPGNNGQGASTEAQGSDEIFILPEYSGPIGCKLPMAREAFETAKAGISARSFEDSKFTAAKQITESHCLLAGQVKEIMELFSFEDTKLKYAKLAHDHVYDLGHFYQVNDAFDDESSIEELNRAINGR